MSRVEVVVEGEVESGVKNSDSDDVSVDVEVGDEPEGSVDDVDSDVLSDACDSDDSEGSAEVSASAVSVDSDAMASGVAFARRNGIAVGSTVKMSPGFNRTLGLEHCESVSDGRRSLPRHVEIVRKPMDDGYLQSPHSA